MSHPSKNDKKAMFTRIYNLPIRYERVQKVKSIGHTTAAIIRSFCSFHFSVLKNLKTVLKGKNAGNECQSSKMQNA